MERNVCGVKKPSISPAGPSAAVSEQPLQEGRPLRKAAVQATSALSAAAASSRNVSEESLDEDFDGNPTKRRRAGVNNDSNSLGAREPSISSATADKLGVSKHTKLRRKSGGSKMQQALQAVERLDLEQDLEPGARRVKEEALRDGECFGGIKVKPSWRAMPGLLPRWVSRRGGDTEGGDWEDRARISWEVGDVCV